MSTRSSTNAKQNGRCGCDFGRAVVRPVFCAIEVIGARFHSLLSPGQFTQLQHSSACFAGN